MPHQCSARALHALPAVRALWQCSCPRSSAVPASLRRFALQARCSRHAPEVSAAFCLEATFRHVQTESRRPSEAVVACAPRARQSKTPRPGIDPGSSERQAQHDRQRPKRVRTCSRLASCKSAQHRVDHKSFQTGRQSLLQERVCPRPPSPDSSLCSHR